MDVSPTVKHYLISFVAGALLAASTVMLEQLANGLAVFSWPAAGAAVAGGVLLFGRDFLRNNTGAFLEGVAPAVVVAGVKAEPQAIVAAVVNAGTPSTAVSPTATPTTVTGLTPVMVMRPPREPILPDVTATPASPLSAQDMQSPPPPGATP